MLFMQAAQLQQQRTTGEMELQRLDNLDNKLAGEIAKVSKKLQILHDQIKTATRSTLALGKSNEKREQEVQIQQKASTHMAQSLRQMIHEVHQLKKSIAEERAKQNDDYETWKRKLEQ